jgi:hypothetical protein
MSLREICRRTLRKFSPEEKIRIVLEGLRGEQKVTPCEERCRTLLHAIGRSRESPPKREATPPGGSGCSLGDWPDDSTLSEEVELLRLSPNEAIDHGAENGPDDGRDPEELELPGRPVADE